jgi:DNA-directed RNA polymerase subunit RPC12/RpoP
MPGEKSPNITQYYCADCGSAVSNGNPETDTPKSSQCPNCKGFNIVPGNMKFTPDKPGSQFNPLSNDPHKNPIQVQKGVAIAFNHKHVLKISEVEDNEEKKVKDTYVSEEFLQCYDPSERKNRGIDDDITKSCLDLEMDG